MVSKKSPSNLVNGSAYLLFYRRRNNPDTIPLGPSYLQDIVHQAYAPASDENSPAGNGRRLGDSSPGGSPRDSSAAGAGALGGSAAGAMITTTTMTTTTNDDEQLPAYDDDDEGVHMVGGPHQQQQPLTTTNTGGQWNWPATGDGAADDDDEDGTDLASDAAAPPGSGGSTADLKARMLEFEGDEDDDLLSGPGNVTPVDSPPLHEGPQGETVLDVGAELEMPDLVGGGEEEDVVAEVRVEEVEGKSD